MYGNSDFTADLNLQVEISYGTTDSFTITSTGNITLRQCKVLPTWYKEFGYSYTNGGLVLELSADETVEVFP